MDTATLLIIFGVLAAVCFFGWLALKAYKGRS